MVVNFLNVKRGSGKTLGCIANCRHGVFEGKRVLLLVKNQSEINRIVNIFYQKEYEELSKIDIVPFASPYFQRMRGKKYDLIVIDECFEMHLDDQANLLEDMYRINPDCCIVGFGTEVRRKTFRDYMIDSINGWEPSEESKEIIKKGGWNEN